jgi:hypothetical protein
MRRYAPPADSYGDRVGGRNLLAGRKLVTYYGGKLSGVHFPSISS